MLVPKELFLALTRSGRFTLPFAEANTEPAPQCKESAFSLDPPRGDERVAPGPTADLQTKIAWQLDQWRRACLAADAAAWQSFAELVSDDQWDEFWRGYPYTGDVRGVCREFAEQTGLAAELARLEAGEAEMQDLLRSAAQMPRNRLTVAAALEILARR